jgi:hypothetical protein
MTSQTKKILLLIGVTSALLLVLAACGSTPTTAPPAPTETVQVSPSPAPSPTPALEIPNEVAWAASPHAAKDAEAFNHWNEASPAEIPVTCAKCHSTPGFQDYVGADGSTAFQVDKPAAIGTVITCSACHNEATAKLTTVKFPSGAELTGLGPEAVCMTCHQGTASGSSVDASIEKAGLKDDDTVSKDLTFTNIHYFAASVARYGDLVKGGYEYPGKTYDTMFEHVVGYQTCVQCHDPHSTELKIDECSSCHTGVKTVEDLHNVRMNDSLVDYNGNGNVKEGLYYEVQGMQTLLLQAIQAYAKEVSKTPIAYSPDSYPYFFIDTNGNGTVDKDEATSKNAYNAWTGRLVKAAFNYQLSVKDPGAYAHGGKYVIELLYDSIDSLNQKLSTPIDLSKASRTSAGHFTGASEAFRHWDAEGEVPGTCAKCHSGAGLPQFLAEGVNISNPPTNGLRCETCHNDVSKFTRYQVADVKFPSGATVTFGENNDANLCLECHQGRESTVSVNKAVAGQDPDKPVDKLTFKNVHYFAAGATMFGTDVKGMYEYPGKTYAGQFKHVPKFDTCIGCHDAHTLAPDTSACQGCHQVNDPMQVRAPNDTTDYDGNGKVEGLGVEVSNMNAKLYAAIQAYAKDVLKKPIIYSPDAYPYFFNDTNGNGQLDPDEANAKNAYATWSPRLLEAAYNYHYVIKDPGAFVHNGPYVMQVLYDSIQDLGKKVTVDMKGMVRPQ